MNLNVNFVHNETEKYKISVFSLNYIGNIFSAFLTKRKKLKIYFLLKQFLLFLGMREYNIKMYLNAVLDSHKIIHIFHVIN